MVRKQVLSSLDPREKYRVDLQLTPDEKAELVTFIKKNNFNARRWAKDAIFRAIRDHEKRVST